MSLDPWGYQEFFRRSRAEWTVAKDQNVRLQSGWFSERDACYLACGKPVIAQSTGFEKFLPTGEGLFAFRTMDEILAAMDRIESDYPRACRAARAIAERAPGGDEGLRAASWRTSACEVPDRQRRRLRLRAAASTAASRRPTTRAS